MRYHDLLTVGIFIFFPPKKGTLLCFPLLAMTSLRIPWACLSKRFPLGAATLAYQIESAVNEDGQGLTIWDQFAAAPGAIHQGETGASRWITHRMPEDVVLMKQLHIQSVFGSVEVGLFVLKGLFWAVLSRFRLSKTARHVGYDARGREQDRRSFFFLCQ